MFSAPAQLALAFQKYSCTLALLAKTAALNPFLAPLTCARKDPPHADLRRYGEGEQCCASRELRQQEVAGEQEELPAGYRQQPWKAQGKKIIRLETSGRNRAEKMGAPHPLPPVPQAPLFQRRLRGLRAAGQILPKRSREVLFSISGFPNGFREGRRLVW